MNNRDPDIIKVNCPHCGMILDVIISKTGGVALRSFDIQENSETVKILRDHGYEFGTVKTEGGVSDGK